MDKFKIGTRVNIVRGDMKGLAGVITESDDITKTVYHVKIDGGEEEKIFLEHDLDYENILDTPIDELINSQICEREMDNMSDELKMLFERVDMLKDEIEKVERAIISIQNGIPITEAFNEEIYLESLKSDEVNASNHLSLEMEHLLKLKYCTNDRNHNQWRTSVDTHREEVIVLTKWLWKKRYRNLINYLEDELQDAYEVGIKLYKRAAKKYPDLKDGVKYIPPECKWSLEELMDDDIEDLLAKLPDME